MAEHEGLGCDFSTDEQFKELKAIDDRLTSTKDAVKAVHSLITFIRVSVIGEDEENIPSPTKEDERQCIIRENETFMRKTE